MSSFAALKSLIPCGSGAAWGSSDPSVAMPRSDIRGPVVTPFETTGTLVGSGELWEMIAEYEAGRH